MIIKRNFSFLSKNSKRISNLDIFSKNGQQLAKTIRIASKKGNDDPNFWNLIKTRFQYVYKSLNSRNLSFIANGFSKANLNDTLIWDSIVSRSYELSGTLDYQDLALLFNSICKIESIDPKFFNYLIEEIKKNKGNMNPRYASMIIYSLGRIKMYDKELIETMLNCIKNNMEQMSLISISNLVNGMYQLNKYDMKLMISLIDLIKKKMDEDDKMIEMKTIVSIYQGYCYSGIYDKNLYNMFFEHMIKNSNQFKVVEMIIISNCMNKTKLHNEKLIGIMNKKMINKPKIFYLDDIAMYLSGLMNVKYIPKDEVGKLLDLVSYKRFKGNLNKKNTIVFLQVYSKLSLENERLSQMLIEHLSLNLEELTQNELTNVICCCNSIDINNLKKFIERMFEIIDLKHVDISQHLSRLLYCLKKLDSLEVIEYIDRLIKYLNSIEVDKFEPVNVANILYSMETIQDSQDKISLIDRMVDYLNFNFSKFSNQLLASCMGSLSILDKIDDEIFYKFCENSEKYIGHKNVRDNVRILKYMNGFSYFKNLSNSKIIKIIKSYNIIIKNYGDYNNQYDINVSSVNDFKFQINTIYTDYNINNINICKNMNNNTSIFNSNDKNSKNDINKIKMMDYEEEVVEEAKNIVKMLKYRIDIENKDILRNLVKEGEKVIEESQINM